MIPLLIMLNVLIASVAPKDILCEDSNASCPWWASNNECFSSSVRQQCPKSCDTCSKFSIVNVPEDVDCGGIECGTNAFCHEDNCYCVKGYIWNAHTGCTSMQRPSKLITDAPPERSGELSEEIEDQNDDEATNDKMATCVFPFIYQDVTHTGCTTVNNEGIPWCSTKTDAQHNHIKDHWMNCKEEQDGCKDISPNCALNKFQCHTNIYVPARCRKTCGLCGGTPDVDCGGIECGANSFCHEDNCYCVKGYIWNTHTGCTNVDCGGIECGANTFCHVDNNCYCLPGYIWNAHTGCTSIHSPSKLTSGELSEEIEDQNDDEATNDNMDSTLVDGISESRIIEMIQNMTVNSDEDSDEDDSDEDEEGDSSMNINKDTFIFIYVMCGILVFIVILALGRCCYEGSSGSCRNCRRKPRNPEGPDAETFHILQKY